MNSNIELLKYYGKRVKLIDTDNYTWYGRVDASIQKVDTDEELYDAIDLDVETTNKGEKFKGMLIRFYENEVKEIEKMIKRYSEKDINILSKILKSDGVISVPTDTVFGVCCRINSKIALNKLIETKNRPKNKAFPIMCADINQIKSIAYINNNAEKLIKNFMPGPITLIMKMKKGTSYEINNVDGTIAIRMATSEVLKKFILEVGCPIYMSSANQSGEPVCKNLDEIEKSCPNLDGMLAGTVQYNISSTIVDCTSDKIKILREGPITMEEIDKII